MPRTARIQSSSNIYHVILRGVNRQQLFYDEEDCRVFIGLLNKYREECGYRLHAYCLMGNHVHLLMETQQDPLGTIFRHIGTAFVYWYNVKYERTGHLFQDRYKGEPVNDNGYYRTVFRYILRNPVKAGICRQPADYPYSSAAEYLLGKKGITDTEYARSIIPENEMWTFIQEENEDVCMDTDDTPKKKCSDEKARQMIQEVFGTPAPSVGRPKERQTLDSGIRKLVNNGVSIRQLSRLTGISKKVIERSLRS